MHSPTKIATIVLALLTGCQTIEQNSQQAFLIATKTKRDNYVNLHETSIEAIEDRDEQVFRATKIATQGIVESLKDCTNNCVHLNERLNRIDLIARQIQTNRAQMLMQLKSKCDPQTDSVLFYHLRKDDLEEVGWAIMRGGAIKAKVVIDK